MFARDKSRVQINLFNSAWKRISKQSYQFDKVYLFVTLIKSDLPCTHLITYLRSLTIFNVSMHFEALILNAVYKISWILCYLGFSLLVEEGNFQQSDRKVF